MNKEDFIEIRDLEAPCFVGITEEERSSPQTLVLSLRLTKSLQRAGRSDDLLDTVDYAAVVQGVRACLKTKKFNLLESVAQTLADFALAQFNIEGADIRIYKKDLPDMGKAGVRIYRQK